MKKIGCVFWMLLIGLVQGHATTVDLSSFDIPNALNVQPRVYRTNDGSKYWLDFIKWTTTDLDDKDNFIYFHGVDHGFSYDDSDYDGKESGVIKSGSVAYMDSERIGAVSILDGVRTKKMAWVVNIHSFLDDTKLTISETDVTMTVGKTGPAGSTIHVGFPDNKCIFTQSEGDNDDGVWEVNVQFESCPVRIIAVDSSLNKKYQYDANFKGLSKTMRYKKEDGTWDDNTMVETRLFNSNGQHIGFFAFDIKSSKYEFRILSLSKSLFSAPIRSF